MDTTTLNLKSAAAHFFSKGYKITALGASSGYSRSQFAQVENEAGEKWCLRRWPHTISETRLQFIHRVLIHSRTNGFSGVPLLHPTPDGRTFVRQNGYFYDAQQWIFGKPPGPKQHFGNSMPNTVCHLGQKRLTGLASALATFHLSIAGLSPLEVDESMPLYQHFSRLKLEFATFRDQVSTRGYQPNTGWSSIVEKWLERLPYLLLLAQALLEAHPHAAHSTPTLCHGDLWAQHVFFDEKRFTGLTDFESLCFSSPATDLAQLILHFKGWNLRDRVVQAYQNIKSLSSEELDVIPAAAALDLLGEGCWSITALQASGETHLQRRVHHKNLLMLFPAVELILQQSGM